MFDRKSGARLILAVAASSRQDALGGILPARSADGGPSMCAWAAFLVSYSKMQGKRERTTCTWRLR